VYFIDDILIHVNIPTGTLTLIAKPSDTIRDIKAKIEDETGISYYYQQLKLAGKLLEDSYILSTSVQLTLSLKTILCGEN